MIEIPHIRLLEFSDEQEIEGPGPYNRGSGVLACSAGDETLRPIKVLVIDDNEALTELARAILGRFGREVHTAATSEEGRNLLQQIHPDVVLCDINLPDGLGYDVLASMQRTADSTPPFIFMSGGPDIDTERCRRLGAAAVVAKPCPFAEIDRLIALLRTMAGAKQTAA